MSFKVYLIEKYDFTHENQFFRQISIELNNRYQRESGEHILIGNISCNGHKIDALFLAKGQISVIDFKDYEGTLTFSENNPWKIKNKNGEIVFVKGGNDIRNPYNQVIAYKFSLIDYLKQYENQILSKNRSNINWKHISCIVLFHKQIIFDAREIPEFIKKSFHIADYKTFIDILDSINSLKLNLNDNEINNILKVLNVRPENLVDPGKIDTSIIESPIPVPHGNKFYIIKKLLKDIKNGNDYYKILSYYNILINLERYEENKHISEKKIKTDLNLRNLNKYTLNISNLDNFNKIYIKNLEKSKPKELYVALILKIENNQYPLLHTKILINDFKLNSKIDLYFEDFELNQEILDQLELKDETKNKLINNIKIYKTLEGKASFLRKCLSKPLEITNIFQLGLYDDNNLSFIDEIKSDLNIKSLSKFTLDISKSNDFYEIYLKNLNERYPKNLFIGLNIKIDDKEYPIFYKFIYTSDLLSLENNLTNNIEIDLNDLEIYQKILDDFGLSEDITEELKMNFSECETLEEKLLVLKENLSVTIEVSNTFVLGLTEESLYSVQLLTELKKLSKIDENSLSNDLYISFIKHKPLNQINKNFKLQQFLNITPLNELQIKAIKKSFEQPLTVITGPPGNGKTQVVLNLIVNAINNGLSVLFASKNNKAVDNVIVRLEKLLSYRYILRFGSKEETIKTKNLISQIIGTKKEFNNKNLELELSSLKNLMNDLQVEKDNILKLIEKFPAIAEEFNKLKEELKNIEKNKSLWLNELNKDLKSMFIDDNLTINIDINEINLLINNINKIKNNFLYKLIFVLFYKSKITKKVESINKNLNQKIYDYVSNNKPWCDSSKKIIDSIESNVKFILNLKKEEISIKNKNKSFLIEIEKTIENINKLKYDFEILEKNANRTFNNINNSQNQNFNNNDLISSLEFQLINYQSNEEKYKIRLNEIEKQHIECSLKFVNNLIEKNIHNLKIAEIQSFIDYLPVNDLWREEQKVDFEIKAQKFLSSFKVICVTNLSIKNSCPLSPGLFDILIIDEASQCDIASAIPLIYRAKNAVIIGDPLQLKHITSVQKIEENYIKESLDITKFQLDYVSESLFDYCFSLSNKSNFESIFLKDHYRCHPDIIEFSSNYIYAPKLGQSLNITTKDEMFDNPKGIEWIDVKGQMSNNANINIQEVDKCIELAIKLVKDYKNKSIGIISPFRHQIDNIRQKLPAELNGKVTVDTVHKFQGDEMDIIIFSTVVTSNSLPNKSKFINRNEYLLNVAITRAKSKLYIIGDYNYCSNVKYDRIKSILSSLASYVYQLNSIKDDIK